MLRQEHWPSGKVSAEFEVVVGPEGKEVKSGSYRSRYENGVVRSEGRFANDLETGRWKFFDESGGVEAEGSFSAGQRAGPWETFHLGGVRASKGKYSKGLHDGDWLFWNEDGSPDAVNSGSYRVFESGPSESPRLFRGELLDGVRHGTWTSYWPDLTPQLEAHFVRGARQGQWVFHHQDGSISTTVLSGVYAQGRWIGPLPDDVVAASPPRTGSRPGVPTAGFVPRDEDWASRIDETIALSEPETVERMQALEDFERKGLPLFSDPAAIPLVLTRMLQLDTAKPADRRSVARLDAFLLRHRGHFPRLELRGVPEVATVRERVRSWMSVWALTSSDPWFWRVELQRGSPPATLAPGRSWLQEPSVFESARCDPPPLLALRSEASGSSRKHKSSASRDQALEDALQWLEEHQGDDGLWHSDFSNECSRHGEPLCSGVGNRFDVGVSALALLAFLGHGNTLDRGRYRDVVVRGVDALMSVQTEEGELHTTWGDAKDVNVVHYHQDWLHEHGYATAALCEALATHRSEVLRSAANRAVQVILRAQNPYSGWRYSVPGNGDADSAMTGEMVVALRAAQEVEIGGDLRELFTNGLVFLDNLTDPASGRVGYTDMGGLSSRIRELTAQFPAEHTEAMTALALFAGVLAGRAPEASLLSKQEHLLAAKPPRWDPSLGCIDFYYWYYGTYALHQVGRASWSPWEEALVSALLPAQRKDADTKGSWDPVDAWGTQGGRVYSTALAAMCLEVDTRFAQALPPTAEKSKRAQQPK